MATTVSEFTNYAISDGDENGTAIAIGDLSSNPVIEVSCSKVKYGVIMQIEGSIDGGTTWNPLVDEKGLAVAFPLTRTRKVSFALGPIDGYTHIRPALKTHGNENGTILSVIIN